VLSPLQALEGMLTQVGDGHTLESTGEFLPGRLAGQHLPAVSRAADPSGPVDHGAVVVRPPRHGVDLEVGLSFVHAHAGPEAPKGLVLGDAREVGDGRVFQQAARPVGLVEPLLHV
jgi:hypothetical protein